MKRIFLLALGALALATSAKAGFREQYAISSGDIKASTIYEFNEYCDPEHIADPDGIIRGFQTDAVASYWGRAETAQEIDQFVNIAWHEMYLRLKLLVSVKGHSPNS